MYTIKCGSFSYVVDHAVKGPNYVHGYDANGEIVVSLEGVKDFSTIIYDGVYMNPGDCLEEACNVVRYVNGRLVNSEGESALVETYLELTMLASGWNDNRYSFEDLYPNNRYNLEISLSSNATQEMVDAFNVATIAGSVDTNVVTAFGDIPNIDILVIAKVVKK